MNDNEPIMEIRPVVVPAQYLVYGPLFSGFISIFPAGFAFAISNIFAGSFDPIFRFGIGVYALSFCAVMFLFYLKVFKEPERTCYRIFSDKIEYSEGFFSKHQRTVIFDHVIDVQMIEGLLQQTKGAGTITILTQQLVQAGEGRLANQRVLIKNVPDPQNVYDLVRSLLIDENSQNRTTNEHE
jgi:uncharacterized membrane protein YdbT with pleckstrin-like domain